MNNDMKNVMISGPAKFLNNSMCIFFTYVNYDYKPT